MVNILYFNKEDYKVILILSFLIIYFMFIQNERQNIFKKYVFQIHILTFVKILWKLSASVEKYVTRHRFTWKLTCCLEKGYGGLKTATTQKWCGTQNTNFSVFEKSFFRR